MEDSQINNNSIINLAITKCLDFRQKFRILILLSKQMIDQKEDSYEMKKTNQIGRGRGSFISKLSEIMKVNIIYIQIYPEVIHWTDDGSRIKIEDVQRMEK